jgi:hypothetical protein
MQNCNLRTSHFLYSASACVAPLQQDLQDVLGENASILSEEEADMARTLLKLGQDHLLVSLLRAWTHNAHVYLACRTNIVPTAYRSPDAHTVQLQGLDAYQ